MIVCKLRGFLVTFGHLRTLQRVLHSKIGFR
jgi:hypothetical protein